MTPLAHLKEYLAHTRRLRYKPGLEGQWVDAEGTIFIGNRAGPSKGVSNLAHEMSHFVEIDDARVQRYGWGLRLPELYVLGQRCIEPATMQATARELRVSAYQANLMASVGAPLNVPHLVRSLEYMPDFLYVPLEDGRPAYGDGSPEDMEYREKIDSRIRWMANRVQELRSEFTLERFRHEWHRKIALLG
jgi:hypothetical protein